MRIAASVFLLAVGLNWFDALSLAQTNVETGQNATDIRSTWRIARAAYTRELWVGLESQAADGQKLLEALAGACTDQTSVATISRAANASGLRPGADEQAVLDVVAGRETLAGMLSKFELTGPDGARTAAGRRVRVVLVGLNESAATALRVARHADVDGLLLVDPPVGDLPQVEEGAGTPGVDVLLHPRSEAEFAREEAEVRRRLGPWGKTARVLRGPDPYAGLAQRLAWAHGRLRGYEMQAPARDVAAWLGARKDARVVFVGELHGNPGAHRLQLDVLRGMIAQGGLLALSTEQFERDVQPVLDRYLKGQISEEQFLKDSRPWPNYADYRPLIELCREKQIPVIAANIPRRLASRVHKEGPAVIEQFSAEEKAWTARKLTAEKGAYRDKFMKLMGGAEGHNEKLENMFAAQCIKDDTMAESIADWLAANPKGRVLHINGAFHSEGGLGVPQRLLALAPEATVAILTCVERGNALPAAVADESHVIVPASRPAR
ncbi:MAG: ChaN family lipoprotein [Planctomycetes bacterium]|nr:ChaN family lipoprotein [Planctomycetota bacterium]MCL4731728.1 ChaN family lipoprotein [Planctomycetota bacterium]